MSISVVTEKSSNEEKTSNGIQSLEIGIDVLNVLIDNRQPMMLKEIGERLSMHPAKVHRYLVSLIRKNYAQQYSDGRYGVGDYLKRLRLPPIKPLEVVQRLVNDIQQQYVGNIQVCRWLDEAPVVIQSFETSQPIQIITQIGSRMPLLSSATGRLFASYQPKSQIRPLLDKQWSTTLAVKSVPANWAAFEALQKQIVAQGYATVIGELLMGINAISLPLFNEFGMIEYSVTLIGLQTDLPSEQLDEIAEHLLQLRQAITG